MADMLTMTVQLEASVRSAEFMEREGVAFYTQCFHRSSLVPLVPHADVMLDLERHGSLSGLPCQRECRRQVIVSDESLIGFRDVS